jgi:hypothetical protein
MKAVPKNTKSILLKLLNPLPTLTCSNTVSIVVKTQKKQVVNTSSSRVSGDLLANPTSCSFVKKTFDPIEPGAVPFLFPRKGSMNLLVFEVWKIGRTSLEGDTVAHHYLANIIVKLVEIFRSRFSYHQFLEIVLEMVDQLPNIVGTQLVEG